MSTNYYADVDGSCLNIHGMSVSFLAVRLEVMKPIDLVTWAAKVPKCWTLIPGCHFRHCPAQIVAVVVAGDVDAAAVFVGRVGVPFLRCGVVERLGAFDEEMIQDLEGCQVHCCCRWRCCH